MTMMKLSARDFSAQSRTTLTTEMRADRLRTLNAMLIFIAQEAEALGEGQLSAAIEQAILAAELAVCTDLGRPFAHDA
ncbi:hypothetical protein ACM64Y_08240 [Novispirillum sp. DQ9]|uniref:hypothetical protein n=1 Tax=Novispirillum sp. DQ9 TaxID=3398612 RepID=UPI003C7ED628